MSREQEDLEDYIEKQKAYFKQIDEYELEEEEVEEYIDEWCSIWVLEADT